MNSFQKRGSSAAALLVMIYGIYGTLNLEITPFPEFDEYELRIRLEYPGFEAREAETRLLQPIMEGLKDLGGISGLRAVSVFGAVMVQGTVAAGTDLDTLRAALIGRMNRIRYLLPYGSPPPEISLRKIETDSEIILGIIPHDPGNIMEFRSAVSEAERRLMTWKEIERIESSGVPDPEWKLRIDPEESLRLGVSVREIIEATEGALLDFYVGSIIEDGKEISVFVRGEGRDPGSLLGIPVSKGNIRLDEIAELSLTDKGRDRRGVLNGEETLFYTLYRGKGTGAAALSSKLKSELPRMRDYFSPWFDIYIVRNPSERAMLLLISSGGFFLIIILLLLSRISTDRLSCLKLFVPIPITWSIFTMLFVITGRTAGLLHLSAFAVACFLHVLYVFGLFGEYFSGPGGMIHGSGSMPISSGAGTVPGPGSRSGRSAGGPAFMFGSMLHRSPGSHVRNHFPLLLTLPLLPGLWVIPGLPGLGEGAEYFLFILLFLMAMMGVCGGVRLIYSSGDLPEHPAAVDSAILKSTAAAVLLILVTIVHSPASPDPGMFRRSIVISEYRNTKSETGNTSSLERLKKISNRISIISEKSDSRGVASAIIPRESFFPYSGSGVFSLYLMGAGSRYTRREWEDEFQDIIFLEHDLNRETEIFETYVKLERKRNYPDLEAARIPEIISLIDLSTEGRISGTLLLDEHPVPLRIIYGSGSRIYDLAGLPVPPAAGSIYNGHSGLGELFNFAEASRERIIIYGKKE